MNPACRCAGTWRLVECHVDDEGGRMRWRWCITWYDPDCPFLHDELDD